MNPDLSDWESDWDEDLPAEPEKAYQDLVRALRRKSGFGLFFVQCTPAESDRFIAKLPQDIPQKKITALRLVEPIDNLYEQVTEFLKDKQVDILLIKGLEYSLYKYEKRSFGEITEGQFSNLTRVPPILNHLNQQRERFRDDFPFCFVFLLRSFSINYLIHRAPDFFDWRSGVFELPTTPEVVEEESSRLLDETDDEEYLKLSQEKKIEKVIEIQELLTEQHQTESGKARLLLQQGRLLFNGEEYQASVISYDQALKIKPNYDSAWNSRGIVLCDYLQRYEEALTSFDKAIEFRSDNYWVWYNRGIALRNLGRHEEAIASYDQALKIKPDNDSAWGNRGIALGNLGRHEEAIASYDQALKIKPDNDSAWNSRGIVLCDYLQRYEEALTSFDKAIEFRSDNHSAWHNRGIALMNLGRYEEAVASYNKAQDIDPTCVKGWIDWGNALLNLERYEQAIASYDQGLKIKPDYHQAWNNRGTALYNLGRNEEAIASLDKVLKFKPDDHKAWYNKACCYALQGNIEQALENLQKAINLSGNEYRKIAKSDLDFDGIRQDERFQALIQ